MKRAMAIASARFEDSESVMMDVLRAGGSAPKAVAGGFLAAAGADAGVLFAPSTLLVAGLGAGTRAYDGRCRQPGLGGRRPRGFVEADVIPRAAYAAVPGGLTALNVALAYHQLSPSTALVRPGVTAAKREGAPRRAAFLELLAGWGARVLIEPTVRRSWLAEFGPAEGGLVTSQDLAPAEGLHAPTQAFEDGLGAPWSNPDLGADAGAPVRDGVPVLGVEAVATHETLLAVDAQGTLAGLQLTPLHAHLTLRDWQLFVPALARPVLRGVSRTKPGQPLAMANDLRVTRTSDFESIEAQSSGGLLKLVRDTGSKAVRVGAV